MMRYALLILTLCTSHCWADLIKEQRDDRSEADSWFSEAEYSRALKRYQELSTTGDKFAQYRLALMYYFGLGVERDLLNAAIWAGIAQEPEIPTLRKLFVLISQELDEQQIVALKRQIATLDLDYGVTVVEKRKRVFPRAKNCTGSRIGANCDRVNSFGSISPDQGNYSDNAIVGHVWESKDIAEFRLSYSKAILAEFARFDTQSATTQQ